MTHLKAMRFLIGMVIALIAVQIIGVVLVPDLAGPFFIWAKGNSRCSLERTLKSHAFSKRVAETSEAIRRASRAITRDGDLELWDTPNGSFWIPETSARLFPLVLAEQREHVYEMGAEGVRKGDIVIDCGADVGTFTRTALQRGAKVVVAVEPMPRKEPCLRRTFASEIASGRVIVYPKGLWDKDDDLILYGDSVVEKRTNTGWRVPLTPLDKMVRELGLERVDYIKMDIEGAEKQALTGAQETLRKYRPRIVIATEHLVDDAEAIPALINQLAPKYEVVCGLCGKADGQLKPFVMHFEPEI